MGKYHLSQCSMVEAWANIILSQCNMGQYNVSQGSMVAAWVNVIEVNAAWVNII